MNAVNKLKTHKEEICNRFHVNHIGIFGSCIRGENTETSDIDVLVQFASKHKTFDNYIELKDYLEELFGRKVDLVIRDAIKPRLKERIMGETVYV